MKQKFAAAKAAVVSAWSRVPKKVRVEAIEVAAAFVATFIATVRDGIPAVVGSPSFPVVKALVAAAAVAGARAAWGVVKPWIAKAQAAKPAA